MAVRPLIGRTAGAAAALAMALGGCSSAPSLSSLTGAIPSFSPSSSVLDRTFMGAAQTWDIDKSGSVTCDEWKTYAAGLMRESDGNGDGMLDGSEFATMARTDRLFEVADVAYFDANGDGKVTPEELTGKQNHAFKLLDKNADCQIDRNETVTFIQRDKPKDSGAGTAPQQDPSTPPMRR
ncbi:MAG: histidine kinase [Hyphomicrobium sp.]|nr:histidine kinase [Hyphomicrobium sp.]